ncbi:hypothetical protein BX666DRAFT_1863759, partial [Dichotomocladium elegans]
YKFNVEMSCSGCSGAVERALKKLGRRPELQKSSAKTNTIQFAGVDSVETNLEKQEVIVNTSKSREEVLAAIKKTGKTVKDE